MLVDATGAPTVPSGSSGLTGPEIVEKVLMLTEHPSWELYVMQLTVNAQKYGDYLTRPDFLRLFLAEYGSLGTSGSDEIHGFARGLIYGLKLAGALPFALQKTLDDKRASEDAASEEAGEQAAVELSEQGNEGEPGFRPAAHPDDLELEA